MTETKKADLSAAENLREQLENELGEAVEALTDAMNTAGRLKACFEGDPDRTEEYTQASKWQERLLFMDAATVLAQVAGEEDEDSDDFEAPVRLMVERKRVQWLAKLVEFARTLDSADFQTDACDEVLVDLQHALG